MGKTILILGVLLLVLVSAGCIGGGQTSTEVKTVVSTTQPPQTTPPPLKWEPLEISKENPSTQTITTVPPENKDTDNDGFPDSVDPLPNTYGTVTKEEFEELTTGAVLELSKVLETLTQLMNNYNSGTISTQSFKNSLDEQDEILTDISLKLDLIPPREFEELHSYYYLTTFDYQDSIFWLKKYADSKSQSDLYMAQTRAKDGRENLQKAQSLIS